MYSLNEGKQQALKYREMAAVLHMALKYTHSQNKTISENDNEVMTPTFPLL